jgi:hypothetical protein
MWDRGGPHVLPLAYGLPVCDTIYKWVASQFVARTIELIWKPMRRELVLSTTEIP